MTDATAQSVLRIRPDPVFPAPRFPSGVAVAPAVLLGSLLAAALGLLGLRSRDVDVADLAPGARPGMVAAIVVTALGLAGFLTLRALVVRPTRWLRDDLAALRGGTAPRRSLVREVDRIAAAVGSRNGSDDAEPRRSLGLSGVLAVLTVVLLAGLAAAFTTVDATRPPGDPTAAARRAVAAAGSNLRHDLGVGLSGLEAVARGVTTTGDGQLQAAASAALAARPVFRAVAVLDRAGVAVTTVGDAPGDLEGAPLAAGIALLGSTGPEPIVVASAPVPGGSHVLVGAYDIRALNAGLRRSGGAVVVLDPALRTVLSTDGYRAFALQDDPATRAAVEVALAGGRGTTADGPPGAVASRIGPVGTSAEPGWVAVGSWSATAGGLGRDPAVRAAAVILGAGAAVVVLVLAWTAVTVAAPLRRLGDHAEAIAAMSDGTALPEPVAPERIDEVGAIAADLNRLVHSAARARAVRPVPARPGPAHPPPVRLPVQRTRHRSAHHRPQPVRQLVPSPRRPVTTDPTVARIVALHRIPAGPEARPGNRPGR